MQPDSSPMKVLLVTEPGCDGVFRYVEGLAHFLMEQGHGVHLAYSGRRGSQGLDELVRRLHECGSRTLNLDTGNRPAASDLRAFFQLWRLVRETQPDIIHSHSSKAGFLARLLPLVGVRQPQVYHPHAYAGMQPQFGAMRHVYNAVETCLAGLCHTVNCSSDERQFGMDTLGIPPERSSHVANGVDTRHFSPASPEEKRRLRLKLGLPTEALILGSMGRTSAQKDPATLYAAFAQAAREHPGILLYHVGQGELDAELDAFMARENLTNRIIRHTHLAQPVEFHRAVDGFILTSRFEGFSLAVLEALACGQPIILSQCPGNQLLATESLSHAQWAGVGDVAGFAQCILEWAKQAANSDGSGACNHHEVIACKFSSQRNFEKIVELYRKLTGLEMTSNAA